MNQPEKTASGIILNELRTALEDLLECRIVGLEIQPYAYSSSYPLKEIDVQLTDGRKMEILFKDLSPHSLLEGARQAKPSFLFDPMREIETYRMVLAADPMGTAACFGAMIDPTAGRYWLFLEKVKGLELYQVGEIGLWQEAARWLAQFHQRNQDLGKLATMGRWITYDSSYYRQWLKRAAAFAENEGARQEIGQLAQSYEAVIQRLASLPVTFIHGEFYASNILVPETAGKVRVCPVDWEMAALGPGLIDLAALTAGKWQDNDKEQIVQAYYQALAATEARPGLDEFLADLDFCRLHLSLQWLGWSAEWKPPPAHAQGWLSEGLRLAQKRGLLN